MTTRPRPQPAPWSRSGARPRARSKRRAIRTGLPWSSAPAGEYLIDLEGWRTDGGSLEDPVLLGIYDDDGTLITGTTDDDGGAGLNSRVRFEAPETGTYYIAADAYEDYTGSYSLEVMDLL